MNINSPVKMLPQEVKTPLVPKSEMCTESSTMGSAEDNRKAGPDAFADPDAKKRAISDASTGLPKCSIQEDKSPLEGSSASAGLSKDDKDVLQKLEDCLEPVEESGNSSDDEDNMFVYDTTFCGDLAGLENAVDAFYESGSKLHTKCFDVIREKQDYYEKKAAADYGDRYRGKLHVEVLLDKEGNFVLSSVVVI